MIVIVNYGLGNLASIKNMLKKIGVKSTISSDHEEIAKASKLILPGVGAFDQGMKYINNLNLKPILDKKVLEEKIPILGICLGMQLLSDGSAEGKLGGLGWIKGRCNKFSFQSITNGDTLKIPHMGWNEVTIANDLSLYRGFDKNDAAFYFVHSYHLVCEDSLSVLTSTSYGYEFTSSVQQKNIMGVQFHPEKSHKYGMKLLRNFVEM